MLKALATCLHLVDPFRQEATRSNQVNPVQNSNLPTCPSRPTFFPNYPTGVSSLELKMVERGENDCVFCKTIKIVYSVSCSIFLSHTAYTYIHTWAEGHDWVTQTLVKLVAPTESRQARLIEKMHAYRTGAQTHVRAHTHTHPSMSIQLERRPSICPTQVAPIVARRAEAVKGPNVQRGSAMLLALKRRACRKARRRRRRRRGRRSRLAPVARGHKVGLEVDFEPASVSVLR